MYGVKSFGRPLANMATQLSASAQKASLTPLGSGVVAACAVVLDRSNADPHKRKTAHKHTQTNARARGDS